MENNELKEVKKAESNTSDSKNDSNNNFPLEPSTATEVETPESDNVESNEVKGETKKSDSSNGSDNNNPPLEQRSTTDEETPQPENTESKEGKEAESNTCDTTCEPHAIPLKQSTTTDNKEETPESENAESKEVKAESNNSDSALESDNNPLLEQILRTAVMTHASSFQTTKYANCFREGAKPYSQIVTNAMNMSGGTVIVNDGFRVNNGIERIVMGNNTIYEAGPFDTDSPNLERDPEEEQQETPDDNPEQRGQKRKSSES
ncbi:Hypothetical predicted protein [Cloeon dipterum]|uniref:Uncharacterized protein n=1 Tax=Cloeon dipterum TaxID=197152 RepID=A0A8S1E4N1_9INSE|nr:Hypothetical predicted protein [Cloeon dipterum]